MDEARLLELASRKRALFAGERIIDRYRYVVPLGRPSKDAILCVEQVEQEQFEGGVSAAARHARAFADAITVTEGGRLLVKTRFVEHSHMRKLFSYYEDRGEPYWTMPEIGSYDVVVLLDYGHGMFTRDSIPLWTSASYLAVNVQTNAGNYGYNLATKYERVDYLCVDESEARLATQNKDGPIEASLEALSERAARVVITLGRDGAIGRDAQGIRRCPAFTDTVVDTVGAGDAFFAVTALIAREADMLSLLRIGNAAGAVKAGIVGHRRGIGKDELIAYLEAVPGTPATGPGAGPMR